MNTSKRISSEGGKASPEGGESLHLCIVLFTSKNTHVYKYVYIYTYIYVSGGLYTLILTTSVSMVASRVVAIRQLAQERDPSRHK